MLQKVIYCLMNISQNFTLYCKGKQEDIDRFKARVAEVFIFRLGDFYINRDDSSFIFERDARPDICVYADLLPLIAEFTEESGAPLSLFFLFKCFEGKDFCCGYAVFQNGKLKYESHTGWFRYLIYKEIASAEDGESLEDAIEREYNSELARIYGNWVKPVYSMWLDDFHSVSCLREVQRNPESLGSIPEDFITPELCLVAVKWCGHTLFFVPEKLKTPELCRIAVEDSYYALQYVPEKLKTLELCLVAVKEYSGSELQYVPKALRKQVKKTLGI
jgi:hypothetical protein